MSKIGIITIDSMNFGNKLQNYALQTVLESFEFTVETFSEVCWNKGLINHIKKVAWFVLQSKGWKFNSFRKLINWSSCIITDLYSNSELTNDYAFFIVGSDQVWNPNYQFNTEVNYLTFAPQMKRISYAASFGVNKIPPEKKSNYKRWLSEIPTISVREEAGADIVENLIGVRPQVVLDPTLLLTSSQWHAVSKKTSFKLPKKYVLKYFLGESNERVLTIEKYVYNEKKLPILDIRSLNKFNKELPIGPSEFLYLIENAECIITDSFHGSVFSIIFKKPFVVFDRKDGEKDMSSRIKSLCKMFKLNDHRYNSYDFKQGNIFNDDYTHIEDILSEEKEKSLLFLSKSLNIQGN